MSKDNKQTNRQLSGSGAALFLAQPQATCLHVQYLRGCECRRAMRTPCGGEVLHFVF